MKTENIKIKMLNLIEYINKTNSNSLYCISKCWEIQMKPYLGLMCIRSACKYCFLVLLLYWNEW